MISYKNFIRNLKDKSIYDLKQYLLPYNAKSIPFDKQTKEKIKNLIPKLIIRQEKANEQFLKDVKSSGLFKLAITRLQQIVNKEQYNLYEVLSTMLSILRTADKSDTEGLPKELRQYSKSYMGEE